MGGNHGGMPYGPCDLEVLIFDSWSCTPLSEIVSLVIFPCGLSFRFGNLEFHSCVKTLLNWLPKASAFYFVIANYVSRNVEVFNTLVILS